MTGEGFVLVVLITNGDGWKANFKYGVEVRPTCVGIHRTATKLEFHHVSSVGIQTIYLDSTTNRGGSEIAVFCLSLHAG